MNITIECTPLQLEFISKALQKFDYSLCSGEGIPKEGYALADICLEWMESQELERKKNNV